MDSINKDLQNPYLTMLAATKESRMIPRDPAPQGAAHLSIHIYHHSIFSPQDENCSKNQKKLQKVLTK